MKKTADKLIKCGLGFFKNPPHSGTVIGSCAQLSFNIKGLLFAHKCDNQTLKTVSEIFKTQLQNNAETKKTVFLDILRDNAAALTLLSEKNILRPALATKIMCFGQEGDTGFLVNGADHIKIMQWSQNYAVAELYAKLQKIRSGLETKIPVSFNPYVGYLTASPENTGTTLKLKTLVHLPCLSLTGGLLAMLKHLNSLGINYQTYTGGHESNCADLFIVSNSYTTGMAAEEIAAQFDNAVWYLEAAEERAKNLLYIQKLDARDRVWRSFGLLANARSMGYHEMAEHISVLRFGAFYGIETLPNLSALTKCLLLLKPGHIAAKYSKGITPERENEIRAKTLRSHFNAVK